MKPLLFLTFRTFRNGIMRALGSPTRLIGILFFFGYYFMWFIRPAMQGGFGRRGMPQGIPTGQLEFPTIDVIWAIGFAGFAALSIFLMFGSIAQQGGFKPADVDVLFPTPLSARTVLIFRILRDYLFTLIGPLALALLGFGGVKVGLEWLFKTMPEPGQASMVLRMSFVGWGLMALGWVAISYSVSLYVNRSDTRSDRNKKFLGWGVTLLLLAVFGYIGWSISKVTGARDLLDLAQSPVLKAVFFPATLATTLAVSPLEGSAFMGMLAFGGLTAIILLALHMALRQAGWMYDQAAVRGFGNQQLKAAQRSGDTLAAMAALAQEGKIKARKLKFLYRLRLYGPFALLWKDLFLQIRGMLWMLVMIGLLGVFMASIPALFKFEKGENMGAVGGLFFMQGMAIFMVTLSLANVGFMELLRRIDLQKPLPFSPATTVMFEVASKSLLGIVVGLVGAIVAFVLKPELWHACLASMLFSPALSLLLSSCVFLVIILFPDVDDQAQRQFRGIMMLLSIVVTGLPPVGLFLLLALAVKIPYWIAALVASALCLGIAALITAISGRLYANFNPSE